MSRAPSATIRNLDAQIAQQQSAIDQEKAQIASTEASLSFATADNTRYGDLMKTGYGTVQRAQLAESALREKTATLQKDRAGLVVAERKIDVLTSRARQGRSAARPQPRDPAPGRAQSLLHVDHRAGRRHRRRPRAAGRPVCPGRHRADGRGAARRGLCRRQLQGDAARQRAAGPEGRDRDRLLPRQGAARPRRQPVAGQRPRIRAAAARQRDRQLHQDRAARPGEDRLRRQAR